MIRKLQPWLVAAAMLFVALPAFASGEASDPRGLIGVGAGLGMGLAVLGGALGQGNAAKAALEGTARNPQANLLVPMVLGLALIESLVILTWLTMGTLATAAAGA